MTTAITNQGNSSSLYATQTAAAKSANDTSQLQDQFLTLLVTQLQNQDPLNPMENAEVTSQMAQLSTVSGINELNATLQAVAGQIDVSQSMQTASLIGKSVLVPGEKVKVGEGVATPFGVDLMSPAAKVTTSILDASGRVVRVIEHGPQPVGVMSLAWDGKDDMGVAVPDGAYTVQVAASDTSGTAVAASALTYGQVNSIAFTADGLRMDLGLAGNVPVSDLRKVM
ncbi:flagellar hook capping FlgD N-terminal domain-containing protein [Bordetella sp. 02P26C-1]|uniref:flagellar hook capping FlgD N-terminal domain-containing protein n=1 Tax=Bordetella sp. 02P26C-1 TaxID=2683195 RepID=UPI0013538503|nr:flagellar hook capping FlgD N-terminal domain-containing protein [Bordetella sp. 02P26C-1]MVW78208.1 flagellar basal body rod modification protein [Bordetella sp. 02P26C-1]